MANPSFEPTRYGRQRKPGLRYFVHCLSPGLHCLPPPAAQLERCAVMKLLLLFAAINTLVPSTSWAETGLVADYPELPADARKVVERSAACRHFADEIAGNGSERDRQVNRQIKKLRCNSLENDANRIRQKYKSRPEVLRLMDESMA